MSDVGIQESKELLVGSLDVAIVVVKAVKAKLGLLGDVEQVIQEILASADLQAEIKKMVEGASKIPSELADLWANKDLSEAGELASVLVAKVPELIKALSA